MASFGMCSRLIRCFMATDSNLLLVPRCKSWMNRSLTSSASQEAKSAETKDEEAAAQPTVSDAEKELAQINEKLTNDLSSLNDKYKRSLAETENVRQRMLKQIADGKIFGIQGFCKDLLEVADILNKATESVSEEQLKKNTDLRNLFDGLKMTETQLLKVFGKHGLTQINPEGEKFDPNFHEALFEVPVPDKTPGTVAIVQKIGYKLHERTIRPALVGVARSVN